MEEDTRKEKDRMRYLGSVAMKSGQVTMKMGKQSDGKWVTVGGKKVKIEPRKGTAPSGKLSPEEMRDMVRKQPEKFPSDIPASEAINALGPLVDETVQFILMPSSRRKQVSVKDIAEWIASNFHNYVSRVLGRSKTKAPIKLPSQDSIWEAINVVNTRRPGVREEFERMATEWIGSLSSEQKKRIAAGGTFKMGEWSAPWRKKTEKMVKQSDGKWITVHGKKVRVGGRGREQERQAVEEAEGYEQTVAATSGADARLHNRNVTIEALRLGGTPEAVARDFPEFWELTPEGKLRQTPQARAGEMYITEQAMEEFTDTLTDDLMDRGTDNEFGEKMIKQSDDKWITVGGKKVKVGAKGSGKKKSQKRTLALLQDNLLGAQPGTSAYGALKSAIYNAERGKDPEGKPIEGWKDQSTKQKTKKKLGKIPDNALDDAKKLAVDAETFEDFERSAATLTGHQYLPTEVDDKYAGRKGLQQFYNEFH